MVKMIHARFGHSMWIAKDRVEEYKAAGHKLAASDDTKKPAESSKPKKGKEK